MILKKIILYVILLELLFSSAKADKPYKLKLKRISFSNQWKALIHWENKAKIDKHFYLSYPNVTLINELKKTLSAFRSKNHKEAICNFPARYLFLKKYFSLPKVNLNKCTGLLNFVKNFPKDEIGIVFSSEYLNSPQSSFGHIMLIFKNKNQPLIISEVVHFAAKVDEKNFFIYSYKGLTGKFDAFYIREPFFKRKYIYNDVEQRFIFIYWLNYTKEKIIFLLYHLYELSKFKTKYYFVSNNCATGMYDLIKVIDPEIPDRKDLNFYPKLLPIHVVHILEKKIKNQTILFPSIVRVILLVNEMKSEEKSEFYKIILLKKNNYEYKKLTNNLREALRYYYEFKFRAHGFVYPDYNKIMSLKYKETKLNYTSYNPLERVKFSKASLVFSTKNGIGIDAIAFSNDLYDPYNKSYFQEKEYILFKGEVFYKHNNVYINDITLLKAEVLPYRFSPYYTPPSWGVYIGFNRDNNKDKLKFDIGLGAGRTYYSDYGLLNFMAYIGFDTYSYTYIKPEAKYLFKINQKSRFGIIVSAKRHISQFFWKYKVFLSFSPINNFNISLESIRKTKKVENRLKIAVFF